MLHASLHLSIEHAVEGLGTESSGFEVPIYAIGDLGTKFSGPKVSTYDVEAILRTKSLTEPIFLDSEPTCMGRKWKAKDMSGLNVCLCGEWAKPDNVGSIQCWKAGCATVWVCLTFGKFIGPMPDIAHSITLTVLGIRMHGQKVGYMSHAYTSQA